MVDITRPSQLRELAEQLKGGAMSEDLRRALRDAAGPVVQAVQGRIRSLPIRGDGNPAVGHQLGRGALRVRRGRGLRNHRQLRETIAGVVKTRTDPKGITIEVDQYALPREMVSLPKHLEAKKGWRHPTFGRKARSNDWHNEYGAPWFYSTVRNNEGQFRSVLEGGLEGASRKMAERVRSA